MKTSELTGAQLDFWVAKALGYDPDVIRLSNIDDIPANPRFPYSRDWTLGGPIIERERITVAASKQGWGWLAYNKGYWLNEALFDYEHEQYGETYLEAAMRVYVASKFGEELPESTG